MQFLLCAFLSILLHSSAFSFEFGCFAPPPHASSFDSQILLISQHANSFLAEKVAHHLGIPVSSSKVMQNIEGTTYVQLTENVHHKNVLILPSEHPSTNINNYLFELYLLVRATKQASAASITAIIPYHDSIEEAIPPMCASCNDVSLFLEVAGVDRVITLDLSSGRIQGFFHSVPVDNLYIASTFAPYFIDKAIGNVVVASLNTDGEEKARRFAEGLELYGIPSEVISIEEEPSPTDILAGADVILLGEVYENSLSFLPTAALFQQYGAHRIFAVVTHPAFFDHATEIIEESDIEELTFSKSHPFTILPSEAIQSVFITPLLSFSTHMSSFDAPYHD